MLNSWLKDGDRCGIHTLHYNQSCVLILNNFNTSLLLLFHLSNVKDILSSSVPFRKNYLSVWYGCEIFYINKTWTIPISSLVGSSSSSYLNNRETTVISASKIHPLFPKRFTINILNYSIVTEAFTDTKKRPPKRINTLNDGFLYEHIIFQVFHASLIHIATVNQCYRSKGHHEFLSVQHAY